MARTNSHTSSEGANPSSTTPSSRPSRIRKSSSVRSASTSRSTRQRSQLLAEASSSGVLQGMVEEAEQVEAGASGTSSSKGKGKSKAVEKPDHDMTSYDEDLAMALGMEDEEPAHPCPITDKDTKPFRLMDLPTEIRLEIYRACLTRPYNILLSKREQPQQSQPEAESDSINLSDNPSDASDTDGESTVRVNARPRHTRVGPASDTNTSRRSTISSGLRGLAARGARPIRLLTSQSAPGSNNGANTNGNWTSSSQSGNTGFVFRSATTRTSRRNVMNVRTNHVSPPEPERNQLADPLLVNILRASKEIYKEARGVLYNENYFTLDLNTAMTTLSCLHQRSRRQIKHVELEIPTYNEILERFQETVRLSLRYCSGLKKFVIHMPFTLPGADGSGTTGNTTVYANGFDILRWLPQECGIELKGNICTEIETVVNKHLQLAKTLDKVSRNTLQIRGMFKEEYDDWKKGLAEEVKKSLPDCYQ